FAGDELGDMVKNLAESFRRGAVAELKRLNESEADIDFSLNPYEARQKQEQLNKQRADALRRAQDTPEAFEANATAAKQAIADALAGKGKTADDALALLQRQVKAAPDAFSDRQRAVVGMASPDYQKQIRDEEQLQQDRKAKDTDEHDRLQRDA